ncbi:MAG: DUF1640 domain-containing protein [Rhodospirillales bacterium]|nr:DUF1640 domain-containing protein [Rhodospirillales bacterium]
MSVAFDTLRAARKLRDEGGFDERQAATLVDIFAEGMTETLVTKADLEKTEASLRAEIDTLRGDLEKTEASLRADLEKTEERLEGKMRELEQRMTIRLGAMMVAAVALIVALIKLV